MNQYIKQPSENFAEQKITPKYIIIHCIGGTTELALNLLTKPKPLGGGVSAHYFITHADATVYELVPPEQTAYHAGVSRWRNDNALNHCAIGIELHCPNYANALGKQLNWYHFEAFTEQQLQTLTQLITQLMQTYRITRERILAHSDIAPWRQDQQQQIILGKTDPGATFPWEKLAQQGIGVWPKKQRMRTTPLDTSIRGVQQLLCTYGYHVPITGALDAATEFTLKAFQLHFMPHQIDGKISAQLVILLENLIDGECLY